MEVNAGQINVSIYYQAVGDNSHATPGEPVTGLLFSDLTYASYVRQGGTVVDITPVTLASVGAAHADGGFIEVDATKKPGEYRFDIPDAAIVAGVNVALVSLVAAAAKNAYFAPKEISIKGGVALTEAYAASGAAATDVELLYMIWSALANFAISDVTMTGKKLDGSTTSMTFALDDPSNPASRIRAT